MNVLSIWDTQTNLKTLVELKYFEGSRYLAETQALYNEQLAWNAFFSSLPPQLVSLSFESEAEQTHYLSQFQQKAEIKGIYSLHLPMATSTTLVGYYGHTPDGFFAHVAPDMVS